MTHTTQHTPGPWEHKGNRVYRKDSYAIAWIEGQGPQPEWKANGKLIAAAPAMYEALREALEQLNACRLGYVDTGKVNIVYQAVKKALAQAEGGGHE